MEKRYLRKDGGQLWAQLTVSLLHDAAGRPVNNLGMVEDITERKQAEERLQKAHDELERRVEDRTNELSQANQRLRSEIAERHQAEGAFRREHHILNRMLQASDHERQVIAYEIHDGLAQHLAGAIMQFDVHRHLEETHPEDSAKAYDAAMTMLRQGHSEARRLIAGVRPPILDEEGIVAAIAHLANEHRRKKGPAIEYRNEVDFARLPPILENAVYRIVQEALANACEHSRSKKVRLELVQCGQRLRIEVQDWGVGFQPDNVGESRFGLAGIRERARLLGGEASIDSELGKGTRIVVELPMTPHENSPGNAL